VRRTAVAQPVRGFHDQPRRTNDGNPPAPFRPPPIVVDEQISQLLTTAIENLDLGVLSRFIRAHIDAVPYEQRHTLLLYRLSFVQARADPDPHFAPMADRPQSPLPDHTWNFSLPTATTCGIELSFSPLDQIFFNRLAFALQELKNHGVQLVGIEPNPGPATKSGFLLPIPWWSALRIFASINIALSAFCPNLSPLAASSLSALYCMTIVAIATKPRILPLSRNRSLRFASPVQYVSSVFALSTQLIMPRNVYSNTSLFIELIFAGLLIANVRSALIAMSRAGIDLVGIEPNPGPPPPPPTLPPHEPYMK
jgi:hypothetical protein